MHSLAATFFGHLIRRRDNATGRATSPILTKRRADRDNADFGYRRMAVERPLRLNFAVTDERLARVREAKAFANLAASKKRKDTKAAQAEMTK